MLNSTSTAIAVAALFTLSACAEGQIDKQTVGTLIGAGLGGLAGSQIGSGTGQLAAIGVGDSGSVRDSKWDGAIAVMILRDDKDDGTDSLKDELDLFRRENDFDLD